MRERIPSPHWAVELRNSFLDIGTSPISVWNSLDTSGIISSIPSCFSFNNWWDWQKLIEEHAWNYIHNAVEEDIVTKQK